MNRLYFLSAVVFFLFIAGEAGAQFVGPGVQINANSVKAILQNPVDDTPVTLRGRITKRLSHEKYMFNDGTGEIRVDIDADHFMPGMVFTPETLVEIFGEVDKDPLWPAEIDVKMIQIVAETARTPVAVTVQGTTVKSILDHPVDDAMVNLSGNIVKHIGKDKYLFDDGTAQIRVEIDDKYFPAGVVIKPQTVVNISGKLDRDFHRLPEIDVKSVVKVVTEKPLPKRGFSEN